MTATGSSSPAPRVDPLNSVQPERLLLVVACGGQRCRVLRQLQTTATTCGDGGTDLLRDAVRQRRNAVLISTGCLGACSHGSVVVVGWATRPHSASLSWSSPPIMVGLAERPQRTNDLARWIRGSAPAKTTMPIGLRHDNT